MAVRCIPELLVAAAILAAVEGRHLAARTCARNSQIAGVRTSAPPGRMPRLYGSQDGRRYSAVNKLGMHGALPKDLLAPILSRAFRRDNPALIHTLL